MEIEIQNKIKQYIDSINVWDDETTIEKKIIQHDINNIQDEYMTSEIICEIVKKNPKTIKKIKHTLLTEDVIIKAIEQFDESHCYTYELFEFIPIELLTTKICVSSVKNSTYHYITKIFNIIPKCLMNDEIILHVGSKLGCDFIFFMNALNNDWLTEKILVNILNIFDIYIHKCTTKIIINLFSKFSMELNNRYKKRIGSIIGKVVKYELNHMPKYNI